jgi:hypothetical protein
MPLSVYLEAEFVDGFVLREDEEDVSAFVDGKNVFYDILNRLHEPEHGPMLRLALVCPDNTYSIDWALLPENARPVRFKHMERDMNENGEWIGPARVVQVDFGFQYTSDGGRNVQEIKEIAFV